MSVSKIILVALTTVIVSACATSPVSVAIRNHDQKTLETLLSNEKTSELEASQSNITDAILTDNVDAFQSLVEHGADIWGDEPYQPLTAVLILSADNDGKPHQWDKDPNDGKIKMLNILLNAAKRQGRLAEYVNRQGRPAGATALHIAANLNAFSAARLLLESGANINAKTTRFYAYQAAELTPLHFAALWGSKEMYDFLLSQGADKSIPNADGQTALALLQAREAKKQSGDDDFQWGKLLAVGAAVGIGAAYGLDGASQANLMAGAAVDSMPGQQGISNTQAAGNENLTRIAEEGRVAREQAAQQQMLAQSDQQYRANAAAQANAAATNRQQQDQLNAQAQAQAKQQADYNAYINNIKAQNENIRAAHRAGKALNIQEIPLPPDVAAAKDVRVPLVTPPNVMSQTGMNQPVGQFGNRPTTMASSKVSDAQRAPLPSQSFESVALQDCVGPLSETQMPLCKNKTGNTSTIKTDPTSPSGSNGKSGMRPNSDTTVDVDGPKGTIAEDVGCRLVSDSRGAGYTVIDHGKRTGVEFKLQSYWNGEQQKATGKLVATNKNGKPVRVDLSGSQFRCQADEGLEHLVQISSVGLTGANLSAGQNSGVSFFNSPCAEGEHVAGICLQYTVGPGF